MSPLQPDCYCNTLLLEQVVEEEGRDVEPDGLQRLRGLDAEDGQLDVELVCCCLDGTRDGCCRDG